MDQLMLFALLHQFEVLHEDDAVHVEGDLDFVGDFDDCAVGDVILDDLDDASLA